MRIDILAAVPGLLNSFLSFSIIKKAIDKGVVDIRIHDLKDFSADKHKHIDDYPYGGLAGMVLTIQPVFDALKTIKDETGNTIDEVIFPTPDAPLYTQNDANMLATKNHLIFICGHYKGIDQRIRDHLVTKEFSIGDYVISGGELSTAVIVDSIVRLLPGAIGDEESALTDSFQNGLLSPPVYTRPAEFNGWKVPDILLSGNHKKIEEWLHNKSFEKTKKIRPDLLKVDSTSKCNFTIYKFIE
jgi:tRNA (guanine37-N1)-methyltransferase